MVERLRAYYIYDRSRDPVDCESEHWSAIDSDERFELDGSYAKGSFGRVHITHIADYTDDFKSQIPDLPVVDYTAEVPPMSHKQAPDLEPIH